MTDSNNAIIRDLATAGLQTKKFDLNDYEQGIILPSGFSVQMLDDYKEVPRFAESDVKINSLESFILYVNEYKQNNTAIFGCPDGRNPFHCIVDYHADKPGWKRHNVSLKVSESIEWQSWLSNQKDRMSQRSFLHFIEDNLADIQQPSHAALLESIKSVSVRGKSSQINKVDHNSEESDASSAISIGSEVPETLSLALRPWKYSEHYEIKARIMVHLDGQSVSFSYQVTNSDKALEKLFNSYREQIEESTGIKVFV